MTPVTLRHPRATRQSLLMGALALITSFLALLGLVSYDGALKLFALVLAIPALFFGYMSIRTATLRVRLDADGVWEPNPFRLTYVTPWSDIRQVRKSLSQGRVRFVGVQMVYRDGVERDIVALKMQSGAAGSEDTVDGWVEAIRAAKVEATR
ncbi:hypothetical protein [Demequina sp.]|uniref:hypothetical protein n=1 Tax=Demequina sp. TaxID=2050685 RepID=UPI003D0DD5B3